MLYLLDLASMEEGKHERGRLDAKRQIESDQGQRPQIPLTELPEDEDSSRKAHVEDEDSSRKAHVEELQKLSDQT